MTSPSPVAPPAGPADPSPGDGTPAARRRPHRLGTLLAVVPPLVALLSLLTADLGITGQRVASTWQLVDLRVLADDPFGSVWYLHTQPPLHNLVIGLVAWLPLPFAGTLFVLLALALVATSLLLADLLRGWGLGPVAAGAVAGLACCAPGLLRQVDSAGYEVPVTLLVVATLVLIRRHLDAPDRGWLVGVALALTLGAMTRSLLHPTWVAGVLVLVVVARPVPRRHVVAAALIPLVVIGGWVLKNDVVFGSPTLSSWTGFNLQRGVVATTGRDQVAAAVADGEVSDLALRHPWGELDDYEGIGPPCRPRHDHPAASRPTKVVDSIGGAIANFNDECYLPLYAQAAEDARTLALRYPARYVATRRFPLTVAYDVGEPCDVRRCTWVEQALMPAMAPVVTEIPVRDWNLPLLGGRGPLPVRFSLTLLAGSLAVLVGAGVAVARLRRIGWRHRSAWPTAEVQVVVLGGTLLLVVAGAALVEFGENARFRSSLDPLLLAFLAATVVRAGRGRLRTRKLRG